MSFQNSSKTAITGTSQIYEIPVNNPQSHTKKLASFVYLAKFALKIFRRKPAL